MPALKDKKFPNINFLAEEEFEKTTFGKFIKWALSIGRYVIVFTEFIVILAFLSRFKFDQDLTDLHESIDQKRAIIASAVDLEKEIRSLNDTLTKVVTLANNQTPYTSLIKNLSQIIPDEITIESLSLDRNNLTLMCNSPSAKDLADLIYQLRLSPRISEINISNINRRMEEAIKFNVTIILSPNAFTLKEN